MGTIRGGGGTLTNHLSRGNTSSPSLSAGTFLGFGQNVGERLTPTISTSSGGGAFSGPGVVNLNSPGGRQSTVGMNLFQSSSSAMGRPLFSREKSKMVESVNTFDPSEFPLLVSRDSSSSNNMSLSSRSNYVVMVKQPAMETSKFTMSSEDFPALPGPPSVSATSNVNNNLASQFGHSASEGSGSTIDQMGSSTVSKSVIGPHDISSANTAAEIQLQKRGIQTNPDGLVTNIPPSMVTDQYGMIGLLTFIRAAETDSNLVSLALGKDLTSLGLNLNSDVSLHLTFGGPWAETPCRPQDIDYHVPYEYLTNASIRDKLAPVKLNRYKDDVLFFMFYTNVGDVLQLAAAAELYSRDWRYHKDDRVWITRAPGTPPLEKTETYERGTYYFFDVTNWRKVPKEFHLDYDKLEERPSLPNERPAIGHPGNALLGLTLQGSSLSASSSPGPQSIQGLPHGSGFGNALGSH